MQCKICGYFNSSTIRGAGIKCYQCGAPINVNDKNKLKNPSDKVKGFSPIISSEGIRTAEVNVEDISDIYKWFSTV